MKQSILRIIFTSIIALPLFFLANSYADQIEKGDSKVVEKSAIKIPKYARVFSTEATFENAKDDLLQAISEEGLVLSYTSHAKSMLDNTAAVSSINKTVYADAEILLFCKADLSHKLVAGNPHNIVLCPYSIAIYVLNDEPERVYISYRSIEADDDEINALTKPIEALLVDIIEAVI